MTVTFPLGRVVATTFLTVALMGLAAGTGRGQNPAPAKPSKDQQIAELEKQLAELQSKLKALKEPAATSLAATSEVLPSAWVNKFQWRCIGPATMGGRITSLAVFEADPTTYW